MHENHGQRHGAHRAVAQPGAAPDGWPPPRHGCRHRPRRIALHLTDESFSMHYLLGTEAEDSYLWKSRMVSGKYVHFSEMQTYLNIENRQGTDVIKICGGEAGVSRLAIRRRLNVGGNLDLVTGVDLTKPERQKELFDVLESSKPLVVVMAPPCTAFGGWSHVQRVRDPKAFAKARAKGEQLADLCAKVAQRQIEAKRHFLIENPRGSEMFSLPSFRKLQQRGIVTVNFPQCAVGLQSPNGQAIQKFTSLWASSDALVDGFRTLYCDHKSHWTLEGGAEGSQRRTAYAQVWPKEMCKIIVDGIQRLAKSEFSEAYVAAARGRPCH